MKVLVCGGRDFDNEDFVWECLDRAHAKRPISMLINGDCRGVDTAARIWAENTGVHCATVPALWGKHGRGAGPRRNAAMLTLGPDAVIAFPGGAGTAGMVALAKGAGVKVWEPKP